MIRLENLHKTFGQNAVLRGVDLQVPAGTSMVVIGGSGTGKSVLIKSILGLVTPDSGRIFVDGEDIASADREAFLARFGMLFQAAALFDSLPVWQNVAFRLLRGTLKRPQSQAREIAIEKLRRVGLSPMWQTDCPPSCREACKNALASPARLRQIRRSYSLTSRPPGSTRLCQV